MVEKIFPVAIEEEKVPVSASERNYLKSAPTHKTIKRVNVEKLMPLMLKLIHEQQAQINELKSSKS